MARIKTLSVIISMISFRTLLCRTCAVNRFRPDLEHTTVGQSVYILLVRKNKTGIKIFKQGTLA